MGRFYLYVLEYKCYGTYICLLCNILYNVSFCVKLLLHSELDHSIRTQQKYSAAAYNFDKYRHHHITSNNEICANALNSVRKTVWIIYLQNTDASTCERIYLVFVNFTEYISKVSACLPGGNRLRWEYKR